jgi:hypothetical protein
MVWALLAEFGTNERWANFAWMWAIGVTVAGLGHRDQG